MKPTDHSAQIDEISAAWKRAARHEGIDHEELTVRAYSDSEMFLKAVHRNTILEQHRYFYIAQRLCDFFWEQNRKHRGVSTPGYPGHYGCRARLRDNKLEMFWFYNEFKRKNDGSGKHRVISHYIPREGQYRYYKRAFSRAHDWELPVIEATEKGFEVLRRANANQVQIRKLCQANEAALFQLACDMDELVLEGLIPADV